MPSVPDLPIRRAPNPGDPRPRVLIAEDDLEMRKLLRRAFVRAGYRVITARDGRAALRGMTSLLHRPRPTDRVALIVTDVVMPRFSGLEILEAARLLDRSLPVVLITAFGNDELHRTAQGLGASAVFDKPLDVPEPVAAARRMLPAGRPLHG